HTVSLIYGTRDGELGLHIQDNARWWANELGLTEQIVTYYVQSSRVAYDGGVELPEPIDDQTGRERIEYQELLCSALGRQQGTITPDELHRLQQQPVLRSKAE